METGSIMVGWRWGVLVGDGVMTDDGDDLW